MSPRIEMGTCGRAPLALDMEELLATRLLVQGNSGSGKSHLLRRMLEQSASLVQQIIVDPEGDFASLADPFGHVVIDCVDRKRDEITRFAANAREHRLSVVLNLEGLDVEQQMDLATAFLDGLFAAPREHWFPALVVVDEAQLFAPVAAEDVDRTIRKASIAAMTNLMCRGRKRGLAGVIATQRLAKINKNVAAEASNFFIGRTFMDIDMGRAGELLGMSKAETERFRDLARGHFIALGPAIATRAAAVVIGAVETGAPAVERGLMPPPGLSQSAAHEILFADADAPPPRPAPPALVRPTVAPTPAAVAERTSAPTCPPATLRLPAAAARPAIRVPMKAAPRPDNVVRLDIKRPALPPAPVERLGTEVKPRFATWEEQLAYAQEHGITERCGYVERAEEMTLGGVSSAWAAQ